MQRFLSRNRQNVKRSEEDLRNCQKSSSYFFFWFSHSSPISINRTKKWKKKRKERQPLLEEGVWRIFRDAKFSRLFFFNLFSLSAVLSRARSTIVQLQLIDAVLLIDTHLRAIKPIMRLISAGSRRGVWESEARSLRTCTFSFEQGPRSSSHRHFSSRVTNYYPRGGDRRKAIMFDAARRCTFLEVFLRCSSKCKTVSLLPAESDIVNRNV